MKNTIIKTLALVAVAGIMLYGFEALAASGDNFFKTAGTAMWRTFQNVRTLVYVIGAFGLIGIAIGGIMGKIQWKWLGYLAIGLALVAVADLVIKFAIKPENINQQPVGFEDIARDR